MSLPDHSPGKQRRSCWFIASTVSKYVVVRSRVGWFAGHWIGRANRSIRCAGDDCATCASGHEPRVFTYVFLEDQFGEVRVWEIPERLFDLAREIESSVMEGPGSELVISREGTAKNSAICASITGYRDVEELDIGKFVDTLGLPAKTRAQAIQEKSAL